ncbi:MAG: hypothetical protein FJW96_16495 [Actinobacteria bacterium]|nr:hypothetical protein [Actinomycetota bacterium]
MAYPGLVVGGLLVKKSIVFRTQVLFRKPAAVTLWVQDAKSKKRVKLLPGTSVGSNSKKDEGMTFVIPRVGTGNRFLVVVASAASLKPDRSYLAVVSALGAKNQKQKIFVPLRVPVPDA